MESKMITQLTLRQIVGILKKTPEQALFDWKTDVCAKKGKWYEFIKDISAIANGTAQHDGYIFYGVNPNQSDVIIGIQNHLDDAQLQQIVNKRLRPAVDFLYYEVTFNGKTVAVVHIPVSHKRPHIISCDFENLREGQIFIRQGSSTRGIDFDDLWGIFYGSYSPYLPHVLQRYQSVANLMNARTAYQRELRVQEQVLKREMEMTVGLPPGTLTGGL